MQKPIQQMEYAPPIPSWGPPPHPFPPGVSGGPGYGINSQFAPAAPRQHDNFYSPVEMLPHLEKQPHQGISAYGREAPAAVHSSSNNQPVQSIITQVLFFFQECGFVSLDVVVIYSSKKKKW
mgnify:CR=1 FL=1